MTIYYDRTHTYHQSGASIIMVPREGGPEHMITYDHPDQARKYLRWLVRTGRVKKEETQNA